VVVLELDLLGDLRGFRLEFLNAHDVRPVALHPLAQLRLARADAVDVPGGDFHRMKLSTISMTMSSTMVASSSTSR
jgi:hypothetical protein